MKIDNTKIKYREANISDIKDLFHWRNHDTTRPMLFNQEIIRWSDHCDWFSVTIKKTIRYCLIFYFEGNKKKIGTIHFSLKNNSALVSIIISPEMRNKKLASICLNLAIKNFCIQFPHIKKLIAEIKLVNIASKKIFTKEGFKLNKVNKDFNLYLMNIN